MAVRGNLTTLADVDSWWTTIAGTITPQIAGEDRDFITAAARLLPPAPWNGETWKVWTDAVKAETGRKGKGLFMPLRLALTGLDHGPELALLLPLIGRERARERLGG
jgi:glutamyl-tRNA synthetase